MNIRESTEYWDKRVREVKDLKKMVFDDVDFNRFEAETLKILTPYKNAKVLDVGCGYGRLSEYFTNYTGIDASEEMIKLATKLHPDKNFIWAKFGEMDKKYDLVFEVMCLSSLGVKPEEFKDVYDAKVVMCLEPKEFNIYFK